MDTGPVNGNRSAEEHEEQFQLGMAQVELRALNMLIQRAQFAQMAGLTYQGRRNLYEILGYNRVLTNAEYGERYTRGGLAGRVIDVYPNATWRGDVEVVEDKNPHADTEFETAWKDLDRKHQIKAKLLRVDKLSLLSTYAILLIGAGGELDEELPKGQVGKILYLTPYSGGGGPGGPGRGNEMRQLTGQRTSAFDADVSIYALEEDPKSERFGLPKSYNLHNSFTTQTSLKPVHWSRIVHIAENTLWDDIYGLPGLERVWNLFDDLDKVTGGGSEAFWIRANQGLHLDINKDVAAKDAVAQIESLKQQAEEYKHQITRWIRTRGVEVNTLGSDVANFSSPADAIITQIAGSKGIPKRILTGSEMGELASSQDRDNWKDQINGRQTSYAGPYILRPLVDRFIKYGYLPTPAKGPDAYEIKWAQIQVLTEDEKVTIASKMATTNQAMGEVVFTNDEIRDHTYGWEPLDEEEKKLPEPPAPPQAAIPEVPTPPEEAPADEEPTTPEKKLKAAMEQELLLVLEAAIASNNTEVIDEILGLSHP